MLRKRKWLLLALLSALLVDCSPHPPDVPACEHMAQRLSTDPVTGHLILSPSPACMEHIGEPECGHCVYIVSGKVVFLGENEGHGLNGKPWSKLRQESVYLPAKESYGPLSTYIVNACRKLGCSSEVTRFRVKLDSLNGIPGALENP